MGFLAGQLYGKGMSDTDARMLFHGDRVRFGDARVADREGQPGRPAPRSWFYAKTRGKPYLGDREEYLDRPRLLDALLDEREQTLSYKSFHAGEFCQWSGRLMDPIRTFRQKTAIAVDRNRAEEGRLFGYEGVNSGQLFSGQVVFHSDVSTQLYDRVFESLQDAQFYIGRSKSAQYGGVSCRARPGAIELPVCTGSRLSFWLMSDLAAWDEHGQPCVRPKPEWLGLPPGRLLEHASFIGCRRYSPWNGYARSRDRERYVMQRGSVLTFEFEQAWTDEQRAQLLLGLGGYLAYGLGEVVPYPSHWRWHNSIESSIVNTDEAGVLSLRGAVESEGFGAYGNTLVQWLQESSLSEEDLLQGALEELRGMYVAHRRLHGLHEADRAGPQKHHWGAVERTAARGRDLREALDALPKIWETRFGLGSDEHFKAWVLRKADRPRLLARIAAEARRRNLMAEQKR